MNAKQIGRTTLHALPAATFAISGTSKLASKAMADQFEDWGYPRWWAYVTGVTELAGASLLAVPRTSLLGGGLAAGVLAGAVATHVIHREFARALFPVTVGLVTAASVWRRRARTLPLHEPGKSGLAEHRPYAPAPRGEGRGAPR